MNNQNRLNSKIAQTILYALLLLVVNTSNSWASNSLPDKLESISWDYTLKLPDTSGAENPGIAGAFAGFVGDQLVVSGGAGFPDAITCDCGTKT